jgi:hypothetical protein
MRNALNPTHAWLVADLFTAAALAAGIGCGTTRMTDTQRTATEQLLVSNAIDQVVSECDFSALTGKTVYLDTQYLDGTVDRGYLVSSLRHQLLASACSLQEDRNKAAYVVEVRCGGVGTDRHALLVGVPQMNVPAFVPGQPSQIPEIPLAKKTDQEGMAKVSVFAYNRQTGQLIWQSGVVKATSTSKDMWVLGAGPFQRGTIRDGTELAGEPLPVLGEHKSSTPEPSPAVSVTHAARFPEQAPVITDSKRLAYVLANALAEERSRLTGSTRIALTLFEGEPDTSKSGGRSLWPWVQPAPEPEAPTSKPPAHPAAGPVTANAGGQGETEPSKVSESGLGVRPGAGDESEPRIILDFSTGFRPEG